MDVRAEKETDNQTEKFTTVYNLQAELKNNPTSCRYSSDAVVTFEHNL